MNERRGEREGGGMGGEATERVAAKSQQAWRRREGLRVCC